MVAWTDSSLDEGLFSTVRMRISPADSELADRFAADDMPVSVCLDFVESPPPADLRDGGTGIDAGFHPHDW